MFHQWLGPIFKVLKRPFFGRFMVPWRNPLSSEERLFWKPFLVRSESGAQIHALFRHADENMPIHGTLILGHPMGKEAKAAFLKDGYTDFLIELGFNVVVFDYNGFGESSFGSFSYDKDLAAVIRYVKTTFSPSIPLGYHGISFGGQWAVVALAEQSLPLDFLIIESSPTTLAEFWVHYPIAYRFLIFLNKLLPRFEKRIRMIDRAGEIQDLKGVLLVYSAADHYTPVSMGERYRDAFSVPTELFVLREAEHAKALRSSDRESYLSTIKEFLLRVVAI